MTKSWLIVFDSEKCPHRYWVVQKEWRCMVNEHAVGSCAKDKCPHTLEDSVTIENGALVSLSGVRIDSLGG